MAVSVPCAVTVVVAVTLFVVYICLNCIDAVRGANIVNLETRESSVDRSKKNVDEFSNQPKTSREFPTVAGRAFLLKFGMLYAVMSLLL